MTLYEGSWTDRNSISSIAFWSSIALCNFLNCSFIWACTRKHFSTSLLKNMVAGAVTAGALIVFAAMATATCRPITHFCTAFRTAAWRVEPWKTFAMDRSITVWTAASTLMSGLDYVARPTSPNSGNAVSSAKPGILTICSRKVSSILCDEMDWVGQILEAEPSLDTVLSTRIWNVSLSFALRIGAATSWGVASNNWGAFGGFLTEGTKLDAAAIRQPSRNVCSGLLTVVTSISRLRLLEFIDQTSATERTINGIKGKYGSRETILEPVSRSGYQFVGPLVGRRGKTRTYREEQRKKMFILDLGERWYSMA